MENPSAWANLDIPDTWTSTAMLRNMVVDHLGAGSPGRTTFAALDEATRHRMLLLVISGHLEVAHRVHRSLLGFAEGLQHLSGEVQRLRQGLDGLRESGV